MLAIALLQIAAHHPGPEAGVRRCVIVALCGGYRRFVERLEEVREPTRRQDDVLIDLADDGVPRFSDARVDGRGDAAAGAVDECDVAGSNRVLENPPRSVAASVVDDDDLERASVALRVDRSERLAQPAPAVVDRHYEADADGLGIHAERRPSATLQSMTSR